MTFLLPPGIKGLKQEKQNSVKLLAQTKLVTVSDAITKTIDHENISPAVLHKILQEMERYRELKDQIRRENKAKVKEITKKQKEQLLELGDREGKEDFLRKVRSTPGIQCANAA